MLARLGRVLGWTANGIAAILLTFAGYVSFVATRTPDTTPFVVASAVGACLAYLLGRASRYVLAGE